jgi:outer membrane lipoprotein SlyB
MWCTFPQIFPLTMETFHMRKLLLIIAIVSPFALQPGVSSAKGCLKGAAVGGVVGHVAGHHAVAGAAAGCVIGHHRAKVKEREASAAQPQDDAARPAGTTPAR